MFRSGYTLKLFQILENDFIDYLKYISIDYYRGDERKKIFSPKLNELLIRIGSQIDIFFRNWDIVHSKNLGVNLEDLSFGNYQSIEKDINLMYKDITFLPTYEIITPFKDWKHEKPKWWIAYDQVKHDGFTKKEKGNLFNVIESLSALFLLNCIHEDTKIKLIQYGYDKVDYSIDLITGHENYVRTYYPYVTSKLFEYEKNKINIEGANHW